MESFHDELVGPGVTDLPERFFDRFVFNLHRTDATTPSIIFGLGIHPARDTVDGFAILTTGTEQRNVRFATELSATDRSSCGPLSWQVIEPMTTWHVALGPNPAGLEFDLTWRARTPAWYGDVTVTNRDGGTTMFEHLFQSGWYDGTLVIDGVEERIGGWYGQRDRSRGVRTMSGGQGLHIWYQAQFPDRRSWCARRGIGRAGRTSHRSAPRPRRWRASRRTTRTGRGARTSWSCRRS